VLSLLSSAFASGCATMKVPEAKVGSAESYALKAEDKGLLVAAHALTDTHEVEEAFNENLLKHGIVPILVVVENRSASSHYIVAKRNVGAINRETAEKIIGGRGQAKSDSAGSGLLNTGTGVMLVGLGSLGASIIAAPLLIAGMKVASDAQVVEHNLRIKEFYSRTLEPGQRAFGYLYLKLPEPLPEPGATPRPPVHYNVVLQAIDPETKAVLNFNLPLPELRRAAAE
jgi:hypothetical protein